MSRFTDRGYVVRENGPVYFTPDMDKTIEWFERVMGWYGQVDNRTEDGKAVYGAVFSIPTELELAHVAPFTGIHLFPGEPRGGLVSFLQVDGIEKLRAYMLAHGWDQVTEIETQPWGAKTCSLTTLDGYTINVFDIG